MVRHQIDARPRNGSPKSRCKKPRSVAASWVTSRGGHTVLGHRHSGSRAAGSLSFQRLGFTTWMRRTSWSRTTRSSPLGGSWAGVAIDRQAAPDTRMPLSVPLRPRLLALEMLNGAERSPKCLHDWGRLQGTTEDSRGLDCGDKATSNQALTTKVVRHQ